MMVEITSHFPTANDLMITPNKAHTQTILSSVHPSAPRKPRSVNGV